MLELKVLLRKLNSEKNCGFSNILRSNFDDKIWTLHFRFWSENESAWAYLRHASNANCSSLGSFRCLTEKDLEESEDHKKETSRTFAWLSSLQPLRGFTRPKTFGLPRPGDSNTLGRSWGCDWGFDLLITRSNFEHPFVWNSPSKAYFLASSLLHDAVM